MRPQRRIGGQDEPLVGWFEIIEDNCSQRIEVGDRAAATGLLLGRYDHCDTNGLQVLRGKPVSRVHAPLLRVARATYLIDTASSNGVV